MKLENSLFVSKFHKFSYSLYSIKTGGLMMEDSIKNKTDQLIGSIKENVGKALDSEQIELEGKLQKLTGDTMEKTKKIGKDVKEALAEKANDFIDSIKDRQEDK
jgi:uncharacterized protein YjbJ (UPF0337 family)